MRSENNVTNFYEIFIADLIANLAHIWTKIESKAAFLVEKMQKKVWT